MLTVYYQIKIINQIYNYMKTYIILPNQVYKTIIKKPGRLTYQNLQKNYSLCKMIKKNRIINFYFTYGKMLNVSK